MPKKETKEVKRSFRIVLPNYAVEIESSDKKENIRYMRDLALDTLLRLKKDFEVMSWPTKR